MRDTCDILISGGGIAGLSAAAAFGSAGFSVICVDPAPPAASRDDGGSDLRTTAILQPGRALLERAGLWERLAPHAAPLEIMRIIDAGGADPEPRLVRDFRAAEISGQPFGWNLPNWLLRREMAARLEEMPGVDFRPGTATVSLFTRTAGARAGLSGGGQVQTRLVIAADGRDSPMREAAGIAVTTRRYGQKALAFAVTHPQPHGNVSTEIHRSGGPFTLVPLPDHEGRPSSAVVWMDTGPRAAELAALAEPEFEAALNARSCGVLGPLRLVTRRSLWPIISRQAASMAGERIALMAEAAHVLPPIGAQGLNMSLGDLACLLDLAKTHRAGLGGAEMLDAYNRARLGHMRMRVQGIDLLNRASMAASPALRDARAMGLNALYGLAPVRRTLMRMGLGVH